MKTAYNPSGVMPTHGGARLKAGRPLLPLDEKRIMVLRGQGLSLREIAERFGTTDKTISYRIAKIKQAVPVPDDCPMP